VRRWTDRACSSGSHFVNAWSLESSGADIRKYEQEWTKCRDRKKEGRRNKEMKMKGRKIEGRGTKTKPKERERD